MRKLVKLAILIALLSYYGYSPAPPNSPSPVATTITITLVRFIFQLGAYLRLYSPALEVKLVRGLSQPSPLVESIEENVIELENFSLHVFTPKSYKGGRGAIISLHGGGWALGSVPTNRKLYSQIAADAGTVVVAPEYRLAPEHPYPAAIDDCLETVKYVFDHAEELKLNKDKIVLTGDSAGGHLTLVTALSLVGSEYQLKGIFPVYPVTQGASLQMRSYFASDQYLISRDHMAWFYSMWLTGSADHMDDWLSGRILSEVRRRSPATDITLQLDNQEIPESQEFETSDEFIDRIDRIMDYRVSPLFAPLDGLVSLPPTFIYVSEHDVLHDDGVLMYKQMLDVGCIDVKLIEWKGGIHGQLLLSEQNLGSNIVPKATEWASKYIKRMKMITD